eukprot:1636758-Rhodomonas_salina.1
MFIAAQSLASHHRSEKPAFRVQSLGMRGLGEFQATFRYGTAPEITYKKPHSWVRPGVCGSQPPDLTRAPVSKAACQPFA